MIIDPEKEKIRKRRMAHGMAKSLFSKERRKDTLRIMKKIGEFNAPPYVINGKFIEGTLDLEIP